MVSVTVLFVFQLLVTAMGPPGGGRNNITSRFTRHMNIISIDEFDDNNLTKIFASITDWHFNNGFDSSFTRLGKVRSLFIQPTPLDVTNITMVYIYHS